MLKYFARICTEKSIKKYSLNMNNFPGYENLKLYNIYYIESISVSSISINHNIESVRLIISLHILYLLK